MKFIHIGDLHIGKRLNELSLLEDQKYALSQVVDKANDVDAVIIAGDIYDKSSPSPEAMDLFNDFITKLVDMNKKVIMISGNHDNTSRIAYFKEIIEKNGVYTSNIFNGKLQTIRLEDENGEIYFHLLPFIKPINVKKFYPEEIINTYEDAIEVVLKNSNIDKTKRNVLVAHQFITGSETCDSEILAVGGLDNIDADVFKDFDYVALGHIHKAQKVKRDTLRYSGSIFKYSLSEENHVKSMCVVDITSKDNIKIELVPYKYKHDVKTIEGYFEDLINMDFCEDYVRIILHDEVIDPDSRIRLLSVFPKMLRFSIINSKTKQDYDVNVEEDLKDKTVEELFIDFYRFQNNGEKPRKELVSILNKTLKEIED